MNSANRKMAIAVLILLVAGVSIVSYNILSEKISEPACDSYSADTCPDKCVVCPPCPVCSSISCQAEEFCKDMGIDRSWYEGIKTRLLTANPKNATYTIEGEEFTLINGKSEKNVSGSASKITTQYFGNEVKSDFNGDGVEDIAFLLSQNSGGTGTFYYVTALVSSENGYKSANTILLGDRIAPQTTEFRNGEILVNYADRKPDEPMTTNPSMGITKYLKVIDNTLVEIQK